MLALDFNQNQCPFVAFDIKCFSNHFQIRDEKSDRNPKDMD
jgi:hypothetical protein